MPIDIKSKKPLFFKTPSDFRKWLEKNHKTKTELLVGFYKVGSGKASITWPESVDEALCFGWIDGIRKSLGTDAYMIRFTPRKPTSIWSAVNIKKIEQLTKSGKMKKEGRDAFAKRKENKSGIYSHENERKKFGPTEEKTFRSNKKAWVFFSTQAPSYQKVATHWVLSAKQNETKKRRLQKLIEASGLNKRIVW